MPKKTYKVLSLLLCFLLIFEQSGFAQMAGQLDISGYLAGLRNTLTQDKFRPLHLRYLSYDTLNNNFRLLLDKGDLKDIKPSQVQDTTQKLLEYFFVGVSLPNSSFWVNLRPDSPDNIIDPYLAQTDAGKILLEADLQLKKDTAKYTSPENPKGKEYWEKLYKKAGELFGYDNITIPTLTRPWIVPDEIIVREANDNAYIYKATLKVQLEQDHLKDSAVYNFNDPRSKELNEYSSQLIRELIIPELTKEINTSKRYALLRQVYYSLILAQWFKQKFNSRDGFYGSIIDRRNLNGLTSKDDWSKTTYFKEYQKSFQKGEYNITEPISTPFGQTIRSYFSGGIDFGVNQGTGGGIAIAIQNGLVQASTPGDVLAGNSHTLPIDVNKGGTPDNVGVDREAIEVGNIEEVSSSSGLPSADSQTGLSYDAELDNFSDTNIGKRISSYDWTDASNKYKVLDPNTKLELEEFMIHPRSAQELKNSLEKLTEYEQRNHPEVISGFIALIDWYLGLNEQNQDRASLRFASFNAMVRDFFGCVTPGNQYILLHEYLLPKLGADFNSGEDLPRCLALFHEIGHYLVLRGNLKLSYDTATKAITVQLYNQPLNSWQVITVSLSEATLTYLNDEKWPDGALKSSHYLLRLLQEEMFPGLNHQLTFLVQQKLAEEKPKDELIDKIIRRTGSYSWQEGYSYDVHIYWRSNEPVDVDQIAARRFIRALVDIGVCQEGNIEQTAQLCLLLRRQFNYLEAKDFFNMLTKTIQSVHEKGVDVSALHPEFMLQLLTKIFGDTEEYEERKAKSESMKSVAYALLSLVEHGLVSESNLLQVENTLLEIEKATFTTGYNSLCMDTFRLISVASQFITIMQFEELKDFILLITRSVPQDRRWQPIRGIENLISCCSSYKVGRNDERLFAFLNFKRLAKIVNRDPGSSGRLIEFYNSVATEMTDQGLGDSILDEGENLEIIPWGYEHLLFLREHSYLEYVFRQIKEKHEEGGFLEKFKGHLLGHPELKLSLLQVRELLNKMASEKYFPESDLPRLAQILANYSDIKLEVTDLDDLFKIFLKAKYQFHYPPWLQTVAFMLRNNPSLINSALERLEQEANKRDGPLFNWETQKEALATIFGWAMPRSPEVIKDVIQYLSAQGLNSNFKEKIFDAAKLYLEEDKSVNEAIILIRNGGFDLQNPQHVFLNYLALTTEAVRFKNARQLSWGAFMQIIEKARRGEAISSEEDIPKEHQIHIRGLVWEAKLLRDYILKVKHRADELGLPLLVVENLSYGAVVTAPITIENNGDKFITGTEIRVISTKVGSTESHNNEVVLNTGLFSESDLTYILQNKPIVIVIDGSTSVNDPNRTLPHIPDAHKGYRNFFMAVDFALNGTINPSAYEDDGQLVEALKKDGNFMRQVGTIKEMNKRLSQAKPGSYSFSCWYPGDRLLWLRKGKQKDSEARPLKSMNDISGPKLIFVEAAMEPTAEAFVKDQRAIAFVGNQNYIPAYFDDKDNFKDFMYAYEDGYGVVWSKTYANYTRRLFKELCDRIGEGVKFTPILDKDTFREIETVVIDLDGTIAKTDQPLDGDMKVTLIKLLQQGKHVVIITEDIEANLDNRVISFIPVSLRENLFIFSDGGAFGFSFDEIGNRVELVGYNVKSAIDVILRQRIEGILMANFLGQYMLEDRSNRLSKGYRIDLRNVSIDRNKFIEKLNALLTMMGISAKVYKAGSTSVKIVLQHKDDALRYWFSLSGKEESRVLIIGDSAKVNQIDRRLLSQFNSAVSINVGRYSNTISKSNVNIIQLAQEGIPASKRVLAEVADTGGLVLARFKQFNGSSWEVGGKTPSGTAKKGSSLDRGFEGDVGEVDVEAFDGAWQKGGRVEITQEHLSVLQDSSMGPAFRTPQIRLISRQAMDSIAQGTNVVRLGNLVLVVSSYWNSLLEDERLDVLMHEGMADWMERERPGIPAEDIAIDLEGLKRNEAERRADHRGGNQQAENGKVSEDLSKSNAGEVANSPVDQRSDTSESAKAQTLGSQADKKGGIDFRALPIVNQPINTAMLKLSAADLTRLNNVNLDLEWGQIQNMVNAGIIPSGQRIKDYIQSCCQKKELNGGIGRVLNCIADIMRIEEERVSATDQDLKSLLVLLESGKPENELGPALSKIKFSPQEPELIGKQ